MKMLLNTILSIVFLVYCLISSAQSDTGHSIGFQLNPKLNADLFNGSSFNIVYALRYNFSIKDHITLGPELSGNYYKEHSVDYKYSKFNVGGFFRYSFFPSSRVKPFFELSPYYTFLNYKNLPENTYEGWPPNGKDSNLSVYLAPGISLLNKSRRLSLDLFCKFTTNDFVFPPQLELSYRFNFRF